MLSRPSHVRQNAVERAVKSVYTRMVVTDRDSGKRRRTYRGYVQLALAGETRGRPS